MDHVVVVDDMDAMPVAASAGPGMSHDEGATQKRLDAIIVEVNPQTLADQLRRRAVEDTLDQEAARPRDRHHDLGKVCRPPMRRRLQMGPFRLTGSHPLRVAPRRRACRWHDATSVSMKRW